MTNTSEIPMRFALRVVNGERAASEFNIIPARGAILPGARQAMRVEFISQSLGAYTTTELILDMPAVQENALSLPIRAKCVVPKLSISNELLDFEDCFLEHPVPRTVQLVNDSKLPAKFVVEAQDAAGAALAQFTAHPADGLVPARGAPASFLLSLLHQPTAALLVSMPASMQERWASRCS